MSPFFTLIVATYNASALLPRLMDSLVAQTFRDFEVLIQDGLSQDTTVAVIERYAECLPIHWQVEKDCGIYDAWNKILPRVRGAWLLFLGADDALAAPDTLERLYQVLRELPESLVFAPGDVILVSPSDAALSISPGRAEGALQILPERIPFCHSSLLHRAELFKTGRFDPNYAIAGDYEFICRTWTSDALGHTLGFAVTRMGAGGISGHPQTRFNALFEYAKIRQRYFHNIWNAQTLIPLCKALLLYAVCRMLGRERAPRILDRLRVLRGLPPTWDVQALGEAAKKRQENNADAPRP